MFVTCSLKPYIQKILIYNKKAIGPGNNKELATPERYKPMQAAGILAFEPGLMDHTSRNTTPPSPSH